MTPRGERSHADDQGAAIGLLTAMITRDQDQIRATVRTVQRSTAEAFGLVEGLANIAIPCLRFVSADDPLEVLRNLAPLLHEQALTRDDTLGPPLPGSALLDAESPPDVTFLAGEISKDLGVVAAGVGRLLSPEEDDHEASERDRRVLSAVLRLVSEAADSFRETPEWPAANEAG